MKGLHLTSTAAALIFAGCAQEATTSKASPSNSSQPRSLRVRTTAYTHSEASHRPYGLKNAADSFLTVGSVNSAAADWSRFPVGTRFRVPETNKMYVVDDYGSALVGTDTIDLYMPTMKMMNRWGTRNVTIDIIEMGSYAMSLRLLKDRKKAAYVRKMVENLKKKL